ncbi:MAG: winged helix-turn-helix transcriptional regulator [Spirochaetales bacterium]|nr:winged helix-turn-helix transcriptional regulator [Spirochaetales bacterium]
MSDSLPLAKEFLRLVDTMHACDPVAMPADIRGMSVGSIRVLQFLDAHAGSRMQDVAFGVGLSKPSVSLIIRNLEGNGMCTRRVHDTDARAVCLYLTKKGTAAARAMVNFREKKAVTLFSVIGRKKQNELVSLIRDILEVWRNK